MAVKVLPDDAAQASYELARCTTTLLIRVRQLGEAGVTAEYAASDDAKALASLCERLKVNVDVSEKLSHGTPCVRTPRRHAEIGAACASGGEGCDCQMRQGRPQREETRL